MNKQKPGSNMDLSALDELIEEIIVDAYGDDEPLWAFLQAIEDETDLPASCFVMGEPVTVTAVDYDGNERRGLKATCRRDDGSVYVLSLADVVWPASAAGVHHVAAFRRWLNIEPYPEESRQSVRSNQQKRMMNEEIDLDKPVDLIALVVTSRAVRCRLLESEQIVTLNNSRHRDVVPGVIITVVAKKQWLFNGHRYLSGEIKSTRIDAKALTLVPLQLDPLGQWDPRDEYWGEAERPVDDWAQPIINYGSRPRFEMEQVIPGEDPDDPFSDPVTQSNNLKNAGDFAAALKILTDLCQADLRCLDAHAHLGNYLFDVHLPASIRHYEVGLRIGELSLGEDFNGVLSWGCVDNRPFLRCMHGYGLCLWRLGNYDDALQVFQRMLWLNPSDNQGIRFIIDEVRMKKAWQDDDY
ncbi:MAG: tetratricopeptide repeat protein [Bacillota bacterium]|nr:tetratricopeptide repeat protein [Bacillota bacterium]